MYSVEEKLCRDLKEILRRYSIAIRISLYSVAGAVFTSQYTMKDYGDGGGK